MSSNRNRRRSNSSVSSSGSNSSIDSERIVRAAQHPILGKIMKMYRTERVYATLRLRDQAPLYRGKSPLTATRHESMHMVLDIFRAVVVPRIEKLIYPIWKNELHGLFNSQLYVQGTFLPSHASNWQALQECQTLLQRYEDLTPLLLLTQIAWKMACHVNGPQLTGTPVAVLHWFREGWKATKKDNYRCNEMEIIQQRVAAFLYEPGHFSKKEEHRNNTKKRKRENDSDNEAEEQEDETTTSDDEDDHNNNRLRGMIDFSAEDSDSEDDEGSNHPEDEPAAGAAMDRPREAPVPPRPRANRQNDTIARSATAQFRSRSSRGLIDVEAPVPQQNPNAARPAAEQLRRRSNVAQQQNANAAESLGRRTLSLIGFSEESRQRVQERQVNAGRVRDFPRASLRENGQQLEGRTRQQSSAGNARVPQGRRQAEDASNDAGNNARPRRLYNRHGRPLPERLGPAILDFFESSEDEN